MKNYFTLTVVLLLTFCSHQNLLSQNCSDNIIYVNPNLITASGSTVQNWINKYPYMKFCKNEVDEIIVDFAEFDDANKIPNWLAENSGFIDFKKSNKDIENIHLLKPGHDYITLADEQILNEKEFYWISYDNLKFYLNNVDIYTVPQSDYYKNYKKVVRNFFNNVKLRNTDGFVSGDHNFSSPFLMSIIANDVVPEEEYKNCHFQFTIIKISNDKETGVLKYTYAGKTKYYDFSDEPGRSKIADLSRDINKLEIENVEANKSNNKIRESEINKELAIKKNDIKKLKNLIITRQCL